jgi:hypothetical protein
MHVTTILHKSFASCRSSIDLRTQKTLYSTVEALTRCRKLTIASLGRYLKRDCFVKHKIKTVDRLFGNEKLQASTDAFYKAILVNLLGRNKRPIIIVDWSRLTPCGTVQFISAAIPVGGRALPILEMPFNVKEFESFKAHSYFIKVLNTIVPKNVKPIVVTDAGFRNCWFRLVLSMGWDYVGRVRGRTYCQKKGLSAWKGVKTFYPQATRKARYMGEYLLSKATAISTHLYLYKSNKMNRTQKNLDGNKKYSTQCRRHSKRGKEPLLLASSLDDSFFKPFEIINIYKKRMQIEEVYRDLKNERTGLSFRQNRTRTPERLKVALLISTLAIYVLWIIGLTARLKKLHFHYQANTIRHINVLSNFMIGWQLLEEKKILIKQDDINHAIRHLREAQYV